MAWPIPRFTNNGDGTVTDNLTGLIWLRDANCSLFNAPRTWYDTLNIIVPQLADGYCGLTDGSSTGDWRLPNLFELESLRDMQYIVPALSNTAGTGQWSEGDPFNNVTTGNPYWSSTAYGPDSSAVWSMYISIGEIYVRGKTSDGYVWPVRGGH